MPQVGFEPTITASERAKTVHTVTGTHGYTNANLQTALGTKGRGHYTKDGATELVLNVLYVCDWYFQLLVFKLRGSGWRVGDGET
jgi:hypothetical protein